MRSYRRVLAGLIACSGILSPLASQATPAPASAPIAVTWEPMRNMDPCDFGPALKVYEDRANAARGRAIDAAPRADHHDITAHVVVNRRWGRLTITAFEAQGESIAMYFAQPVDVVSRQMRRDGIRFKAPSADGLVVITNFPEIDATAAILRATIDPAKNPLGRSMLYCGVYG